MPPSPGSLLAPSAAEAHFGLATRPFSLTPDLRFAFASQSHTHAVADVREALRRREGIVVVTGPVGTGKTMLCRTLLDDLERRTFLSVVLDPRLAVDELLRHVLADYGVLPPESMGTPAPVATRHALVAALQQFLRTLVPLQAQAVILIDEAQHLAPDVLEEIRLLSNYETDEAKLLQIVLVGQPELDRLLDRPDLAQLRQRIARRCELSPLRADEVARYLSRRLDVASSQPPARVQFSADAVAAVVAVSGGVPRVINLLADRALDVAYASQHAEVSDRAVRTAARQLRLTVPEEGPTVDAPADAVEPAPIAHETPADPTLGDFAALEAALASHADIRAARAAAQEETTGDETVARDTLRLFEDSPPPSHRARWFFLIALVGALAGAAWWHWLH